MLPIMNIYILRVLTKSNAYLYLIEYWILNYIWYI